MRERIARDIDWLVDHPWVTAALLALLGVGGAAIYSLVHGIPVPGATDEHSYLLAADTFASGRVANPAHPFWQHFETFHVLQQPTYVSKYPPAQGLVLALGQVVGGHPIAGVWFSIGLMVAAMYWMFRAWLPTRWALLGGVLVVLQLGICSYWAQSYWGGAVAATGGALVFGATRMLTDKPTVRAAVALGTGLAILANSRPFEGLVVSLFAAAALGWFFLRNDAAYRSAFLSRVAVPVVFLLAVVGLAMATYNLQTTGDPLRIPYQVYADTYSIGSILPWSEPNLGLEFRHDIMREFEVEWELSRLRMHRDPSTFVLHGILRTGFHAFFFLGTFALLLLIGLHRALRAGWVVFASLTVSVVWLASLFTAGYPHYVAPATCLGYVVAIESARCLTEIPIGRFRGRVFVKAALVSEIVLFGWLLAVPPYATTVSAPAQLAFAVNRSEVIERLTDNPGNDLVIVKYGPGHSYHEEWVYNRADIDGSDIVWARSMRETEDRALIAYYPDRRIWMLTATGADPDSSEPNHERVVLEPYSDSRPPPTRLRWPPPARPQPAPVP